MPNEPVPGRPGASLSLIADARSAIEERMAHVDIDAMQLVLLLYRVSNAIVYDIESTVHRPAGWSWSAFRLCFTLWVDGPLELRAAASRTGMSRPAVTSLANTLQKQGSLTRSDLAGDARGRVLELTDAGRERLEGVFREHNRREVRWVDQLSDTERSAGMAFLRRLVEIGQQDWVAHR